MKKLIKILQIFFFILFIFTLLLPYLNEDMATISFTKLDIFVYIFSLKINIFLLILIILLGFQLFFGRIFCSFICPLGNLITFFDGSFKHLRKRKRTKDRRLLYWIPAGVLFIVLAFKILSVHIIGFIDPLSIIHRSFTLTFIPLLNRLFRFEYNPAPYFVITDYILLFIIILSFFGERVWCKYICPLGFLHKLCSLPARYVRVVDKCTSCQKCAQICPTNAISLKDPLKYDKTLCILCYRCMEVCPGDTSFKILKNLKPTSSSRRNFIRSFLTILSGAFFFNFSFKKKNNRNLLRPPGATPESISSHCFRCMECVKICPTSIIQPARLSEGLVNLFTPQIRTDLSYCEYYCNLCGKICPNNAISKLSLKEKQNWKIGIARVDRTLCVVWANGTPCLVCEEHCPVPGKAIKIRKTKKNGRITNAPEVEPDLCIGCGICQNKCPVYGAAIRVYPHQRKNKK
ncbi:MAG: 4Fe-4S binding protein [Spirochaetes bacterium]|nr:4Fe-4S binding protein [Spirochaetota bacterium]